MIFNKEKKIIILHFDKMNCKSKIAVTDKQPVKFDLLSVKRQ